VWVCVLWGKISQKVASLQHKSKPATMLRLSSHIPHHESIRNIIFDFGGVICDLDIHRSVEKFAAFGEPKPEAVLPEADRQKKFQDLVDAYEMGLYSTQGFRNRIKEYYLKEPTNDQVDEAWNILLVGIPEHRIRLLETIRGNYRIFLLSNSNELHYNFYRKNFLEPFGYKEFSDLFERAWFSFRIGMKKPDHNIFDFVLHDKGLIPDETLFIDDTEVHIRSAESVGMNGLHLTPGQDISDLFTPAV
jgi:glucose-1-phosphatase